MAKQHLIEACTVSKGDCWKCLYSDYCQRWNDVGNSVPQIQVYNKNAAMSLCNGRHDINQAVDGSVFENQIDPLAIEMLESIATQKLMGLDTLNLYVTGLTVALVAVINVCHKYDIELKLFHFNKNTGCYYVQKVD